ncbi:hypothetical protein ACHAXN_004139 [Cyclotella atomus]
MTYRSRGRSSNELMAAIIFASFLAGFITYLCFGNYQRAKRAMERQRRRRMELEDEKRALALSPDGGGSSVGFNNRRRIVTGNVNYDSPRSNLSGSSSMYTDEKGLTERIGGVNVAGNKSHLLLGGDASNLGTKIAPRKQIVQEPPRDFLDNDGELSV